MVKPPPQKIAVLIDADNLQSDLLDNMLKAVEKHGKPMIRRAYGDWTNESLDRWHHPAKKNSFELIQVTQHSINKNATDIGLVIDAMDIMFQGTMDGFCIVSNDSDFTSLCTRLRNAGLFIMGIGGKHASPTLRNACEEWVYIHNIKPSNYKKRRKSSFRPRKRRNSKKQDLATSSTLNNNNEENIQESESGRWSLFSTSLQFLRGKATGNTTESSSSPPDINDTSDNNSEKSPTAGWRTQLQKSSPLLNNGTGSSTTPRPKYQRNGNRNDLPAVTTSDTSTKRSTTPAVTNNGVSQPTNQATAVPKSIPSNTPSNIEQAESVTATVADQPKKPKQPDTKSPSTEKTEQQKSKQERLNEVDEWKPFIEELGETYIKNLLLAAYYVADNGDEWVGLDKINSNIILLSPKFKYKALGHNKLSNLIGKYPQLMTIRKEGQKHKTKYYVKLVQPK